MWSPEPRPHWVAELNALGRHLGSPAALISLDEGSLLDTARTAVGLDDFGDDGWREGFRVFLRSLEEEADLHLLGRILARNEIVRALVNRLEVRATVSQNPDILGASIDAPVLIVGTGRSGTSLLHELLAQDPAHRVARTWELLHPCPPPDRATYTTDPRIAAADQEYTFWHLIAPEYRTMHENGGDVPNERNDHRAKHRPNCAAKGKRIDRQSKAKEEQRTKKIAKRNYQMTDSFAVFGLCQYQTQQQRADCFSHVDGCA